MKEIELINKRGRREKHFLLQDGNIKTKIYSHDIHYKINDKYYEIDNTLIKEKGTIKNKHNKYKVEFKEKNGLMNLKLDKHFLNINLVEKNESKPLIKNQTVLFEEIKENIDIRYDLLPEKIKERIILKNNKKIPNKITFKIDTDLKLKINEDKTISVFNNKGNICLIEAPYIEDAKGETNNNIFYSLNKDELQLNLDKEWLEKKETKYPVIIDPTINTNNNTIDTYVYPGDTGEIRYNKDILKTGVEKINGVDTPNRALLKFDLPLISTGSQVIEANLNLSGIDTSPLNYYETFVDVHRMTENWSDQTANWENLNDKYDKRIEASTNCTRTFLSSFNITELVKKWYSDTPNYGIMLKSHKEIYQNSEYPAFYSSENATSNETVIPTLEIIHKNQNGILETMDYQSQELNGLKISENTYNGNLTAIANLGETTGILFPADLSIAYNTNDIIINRDTGLGLGWKLSLEQTISKNIEDNECLEYLDEDGTIHYFKKDYGTDSEQECEDEDCFEEYSTQTAEDTNIYKDEDNLKMKITEEENQFILTLSEGNEMTFEKKNNIGYLTEIKNTEDNKITINYTEDKITKIIDANNEEINIEYLNNKIKITTPNETKELNYNKNLLTNITSNDNNINITYNDLNLISKITDNDGMSIKYNYYDQIPYRIQKITECGINNTDGVSFTMVYGNKATTITDNKNRTTTTNYNNEGIVTSTSNMKNKEDINNAYASNSHYGDFGVYKNKLLSNTVPIKHVNNYLKNTSFEDNTNYFTNSTNTEISLTTEEAKSGTKSLKAINTNTNEEIAQTINILKNKTYTFSAYIKNTNNIKLAISYKDKNNNPIEETSELITSNTAFDRYEVTTHYPHDAIGDFKIKVLLLEPGQTYIDDIQLEEGEVANNYNYLENSDFSQGLGKWNREAQDNDLNRFKIINLENDVTALKIKMDPEYSTGISQILNMSGNKDDKYTISFWYKNKGIAAEYNAVSILFDYTEEVPGTSFTPENLNPSRDEWQYFTNSYYAEAKYNGLRISLFQEKDANDLYISNISINKGIREEQTDYNSEGNILQETDLNNETTDYEYDENEQVVSVTDSEGNTETTEYDNEIIDKELYSISDQGLTTENIYDKFGNIITTRESKKVIIKDLPNGEYKIRVKGVGKYLGLIGNKLLIKEKCNHDIWKLEKTNDHYQIKHTLIKNKYFNILNNHLVLNSYKNNNSLFELIENTNGSFKIKQKGVEKYLKATNNNIELTPLDQNESLHQFYFEIPEDQFIETNTEYTSDGKYIKSQTDTELRKTTYDVDTETGLTTSETDSKGITTMTDEYNYHYDNNNTLAKITSNNEIIKYKYDEGKRLIETNNNDFKAKYNYTTNDKIINEQHILNNIQNNIQNNINYTYNPDNTINKITFNNDEISYNYDSLGRIIDTIINQNYKTKYKYKKNGYRTSSTIKSIENNNDLYSYKYDKINNISHIYHNEILENKYIYDEYNQLIKEYNYKDNETTQYTYDLSGNIKNKIKHNLETNEIISQDTYEYNNQNWKDQLTKFNNQQITYDNIGNPLTIGNNLNLTWINGRELQNYQDNQNNINITYKYNEEGIRTGKTVNNKQTKYKTIGSKIIFEEKDNNLLYYKYNTAGELLGFNYNQEKYYYIKNNQNDIIAILDSNHNTVAKYEYSAHGNPIRILDSFGNDVSNNLTHIANINPFRYRSYYYDTEIGLYYLNNRYYNPNWGRFINSDAILETETSILGNNMFSYCDNNPINNFDPEGEYKHKNAVAYALKWAKNFNQQYYRYSQDCTNFVSQALFAGGLKMTKKWHSYKLGKKKRWDPRSLISYKFKYNWDVTKSWSLAKSQYSYLKSAKLVGTEVLITSQKGIKNAIKKVNIRIGDIIYFDKGNGKGIYHAAMISVITKTTIKYAAHTTGYRYRDLIYFFKSFKKGKARVLTIK